MVTHEERDTLQRYFKDIGRNDCVPLSRAEEFALYERIKEGDKKAADRLIKANLRFVVSVAKIYRHQGVLLNDLIQAGNEGLIQAAKKFDGSKNFRFTSYAVWWIRQSILAALSTQSRRYSIPTYHTIKYMSIIKAIERLEQRLKRQPTLEEISNYAGVGPEAVTNLLALNTEAVSITKDVIPSPIDSEAVALEGVALKEVQRVLNRLPHRERTTIRLYYGLEENYCLTAEEIGSHLGVSRERTRQLRVQALRRLRNLIAI